MSARSESGRLDGRTNRSLRPVKILRGVLSHAEGSAWIRLGRTQVLCSVTIEDRLPPWMRGRGHGWVTAEYAMLPRSVPVRAQRGKASGRGSEIQRLIGRSLRAATDLAALGNRQAIVDCDVLEADGGTRVAAITAGWVALRDAFERLRAAGSLETDPLKGHVAAISVGWIDGGAVLDLTHEEDSRAQVDLNVVGTADGRLVEIQGAAEGEPFEEGNLREMMRMARAGLRRMFRAQEKAIGRPPAGGFELVGRRCD